MVSADFETVFGFQAAEQQLFSLVDWAKRIPHFGELPVDDQARLIRSGE